MTPQAHALPPKYPEMRQYPVVENLISLFADWLEHRRAIAELCDCGPAERELLAQDVGVSSDELESLVRTGGHAADELPRMMEALGLDPNVVARAQPQAMRDMQRVCSHCHDKRHCNLDLINGWAAHDHPDYCGNATTLAALVQARI